MQTSFIDTVQWGMLFNIHVYINDLVCRCIALVSAAAMYSNIQLRKGVAQIQGAHSHRNPPPCTHALQPQGTSAVLDQVSTSVHQ